MCASAPPRSGREGRRDLEPPRRHVARPRPSGRRAHRAARCRSRIPRRVAAPVVGRARRAGRRRGARAGRAGRPRARPGGDLVGEPDGVDRRRPRHPLGARDDGADLRLQHVGAGRLPPRRGRDRRPLRRRPDAVRPGPRARPRAPAGRLRPVRPLRSRAALAPLRGAAGARTGPGARRRSRGAARARHAGGPGDAHLHLGHDRRAARRHAHPRQLRRLLRRARRAPAGDRRGRPLALLPAAGARLRADLDLLRPLPRHDQPLPRRPGAGAGSHGRRTADDPVRRAALLREAPRRHPAQGRRRLARPPPALPLGGGDRRAGRRARTPGTLGAARS